MSYVFRSIGLLVLPIFIRAFYWCGAFFEPVWRKPDCNVLGLLGGGTYRVRLRIAEGAQRVLMRWWDDVALWVEALRHRDHHWVSV